MVFQWQLKWWIHVLSFCHFFPHSDPFSHINRFEKASWQSLEINTITKGDLITHEIQFPIWCVLQCSLMIWIINETRQMQNYYHKRLFDALLITGEIYYHFQAKRTCLKTIKCVDCVLTVFHFLEIFSWQLCPQILSLRYFFPSK